MFNIGSVDSCISRCVSLETLSIKWFTFCSSITAILAKISTRLLICVKGGCFNC